MDMTTPDGVNQVGSGTIRIRTTERGLPVALALAPQALSLSPGELSRRILALCEVSARRAQVARRRELIANGCAPAVVNGLNLSTAEELRLLENDLLGVGTGDDDETPETWLRPL